MVIHPPPKPGFPASDPGQENLERCLVLFVFQDISGLAFESFANRFQR